MNAIEIYDPALCCSTGVCGPSPDTQLAAFASTLESLKNAGVTVSRYNLAQEPLAFAQNAEVKAKLETQGESSLPLVFIDGVLRFSGVYPTQAQLETLLEKSAAPAHTSTPAFVKVDAPKTSPSKGSCCDPSTGCC